VCSKPNEFEKIASHMLSAQVKVIKGGDKVILGSNFPNKHGKKKILNQMK
jgi:hypothetical protein